MNTTKSNLMEIFQEEMSEVSQAFGGLIKAVSEMKALEPKIKRQNILR